MNRRKLQLIGVALVIASILGLIGIPRSIPVTINGETQYIQTNALTVSAALEKDGFVLDEADRISPEGDKLLFGVNEIEIELARQVTITEYPEAVEYNLETVERSPNKILEEAGIPIGGNDRVYKDGNLIDLETVLPYQGDYHLVVRHAVSLSIDDADAQKVISSSLDTLGEVLVENGIFLEDGDRVEPGLNTTLNADLEVKIYRARLFSIQVQDQIIEIYSAARTVAEVLTEADLGLQGMDFSIPDALQPVPDDGVIQIVRVREEVQITQTNIPFGVEFIQSDEVELDKREVVQPGEFGVEVTRTRIIYENEQEVKRVEEVTWLAKEPIDQLTGLGTQVEVRTMDTPQGPIEYWRAVNVYATSYSPCRSGADRCYYGTSSGLPAAYGAIGVTRAWYNLMVGQRLYVPGYGIGTIADIGGGVPGRYWIDLAYSDDDYVAWHHNITVYFLTPVPDNIPWILP
ncbi:MAG TPA: ubiquitin-like domain-containing protein [Anaerolineaceae bacterium]|nr:ubiquitin-like domain-containing protein [Anaerolineaceae bacterium]